MKTIDLIIFDCDGTITDSETLNNQALLDALYIDGFTNYTLDHVLNNWVGQTVTDIAKIIEHDTGRAPTSALTSNFVSRVSELQLTELKAVEGAEALISAAAQKYKICVASNGERSNVLKSLELTGLKKYFIDDHVFTKSQVSRPKPAPDLFLFAAKQMGVEPLRSLVIEDSPAGAAAGVAAGMTTFGFTGASHDPQKQHEKLKAVGVGAVFTRLIHIQNHLGL